LSHLTAKLTGDAACTATRTRTGQGTGGVRCSAVLGRLLLRLLFPAIRDTPHHENFVFVWYFPFHGFRSNSLITLENKMWIFIGLVKIRRDVKLSAPSVKSCNREFNNFAQVHQITSGGHARLIFKLHFFVFVTYIIAPLANA